VVRSALCHRLKPLLVAKRTVEEQQRVKVLALSKAFFSQGKTAALQCDVADLPKLLARLLLLCYIGSFVNLVKSDCELKLVILIGSELERHLLLSIGLQELG
jgi:hypothetical protein